MQRTSPIWRPLHRFFAVTGAHDKQSPQGKHVSSYNVPNALTISRIAAVPLLMPWVHLGEYEWALYGVASASATDALDGYLARTWDQKTALGSFLDPLADKLLINGLAATMAGAGLVPVWLVALILGRDVSLLAGSFYYRGLSVRAAKGGDYSWAEYAAPSETAPMEVKPTLVGKSNMVLQCALLCHALAGDSGAALLPEAAAAAPVVSALVYGTAATSVWSLGEYAHYARSQIDWVALGKAGDDKAGDKATGRQQGRR